VFTVQLTTTNPWLVLGVVVVVCVAVIAVKAMQTSGEKKDRESTDKKIKGAEGKVVPKKMEDRHEDAFSTPLERSSPFSYRTHTGKLDPDEEILGILPKNWKGLHKKTPLRDYRQRFNRRDEDAS